MVDESPLASQEDRPMQPHRITHQHKNFSRNTCHPWLMDMPTEGTHRQVILGYQKGLSIPM